MQAIEIIVKTHKSKAEDYDKSGNGFNNYVNAAREANITTAQMLEGMIANKNERRKSLEYYSTKRAPNHESLADTLLDRAVFCIIRYAHHLQNEEP